MWIKHFSKLKRIFQVFKEIITHPIRSYYFEDSQFAKSFQKYNLEVSRCGGGMLKIVVLDKSY